MAGKNRALGTQSKYATSDGYTYLTKRTTVSKAQSAGRKAASNAMRVMGFVVVAENGHIVRKNSDGTKVTISAI